MRRRLRVSWGKVAFEAHDACARGYRLRCSRRPLRPLPGGTGVIGRQGLVGGYGVSPGRMASVPGVRG